MSIIRPISRPITSRIVRITAMMTACVAVGGFMPPVPQAQTAMPINTARRPPTEIMPIVPPAAQVTTHRPARILARVNPLYNWNGTKPGLVPITSRRDRRVAAKLIRKVWVGRRGSKSGYTRLRFGENWADTAQSVPYAHNGCRTRDDLLARDGEDLQFRPGSKCVVVAMNLHDPYTGKTIRWRKRHAGRVQVDHVVPLSYEWRMGASKWIKAKRLRIANDPLNLIPVDGPTNQDKGGAGPASWLPPVRGIRCAYVVRFAQVAEKYHLPVTKADKASMLLQCR